MYEYRTSILRVVDGDTVHAEVDLGFDIRFRVKLRLLGINAPELSTPEGAPAREHLSGLLGGMFPSPSLTLYTEKDHTEKYGRYLATLIRDDGVNLNTTMIVDGFAVAYP